ncbi:MAG: RNA-binding protein [Methanosarcinaceae archaeon]|nr:RNA-binding protein [Methanosarcinaceae archaeon]
MKIKSRIHLRKSAKKELLAELSHIYGDAMKTISDSKYESATADGISIIIVDGAIMFFKDDGMYVPTIKGVMGLGLDSNVVVVDAGAVRFVVNGADVMCPGIVSADPEIQTDDLVIIKEVTHDKPLGMGRALVPGDSMKAKSGKAVRSIHYVGDDLWNMEV